MARTRVLSGVTVAVFASTLACSAPVISDRSPVAAAASVPHEELRLAADPGAVLKAARASIESDPVAALTTVDPDGQPRVRSVRAYLDPTDPSRPSTGFTVWVMTRHTTRKVDQVRANPNVTLYFNDDAQDSYVTIMGRAIVHTDPAHAGAKRHYEQENVAFFWPEFPRDFVMLEIQPRWVEYIGPGASNDERTWRPQAVVFD